MTNDKIVKAKHAIRHLLSEWKETGGARPVGLNLAVLELTKQCRVAWEHRCDAIFSGRRGQSSSLIRDLERQLIVKELYSRATRAARDLADSDDSNAAQNSRDDFEKLYWGELHFVESERLKSSDVESAMVRIRECIEPWSTGPPPSELSKLAADLELACRQSLSSPGS